MLAITNGAELVRKMAEHHTPKEKLAAARELLARVHREENKRIATADEVLAVLAGQFDEEHMTLLKAREIARTGTYAGPKKDDARPIEDVLLGIEGPKEEPATLEESSNLPAEPKADPKTAPPKRSHHKKKPAPPAAEPATV